MMRKAKIHSQKEGFTFRTLCGKFKAGEIEYRTPQWLFEQLVFSFKYEEKKSLCSVCVKEFLYLHWIKGEKKRGSIFPWVDLSGKDISDHFPDALRYTAGAVAVKKDPK